ncbi:MAG TPA: M1 family metallopeptidase [Flavisolibacter sp.]|nr:M1 family metallopeptidase [Flavisolibacter sp.]
MPINQNMHKLLLFAGLLSGLLSQAQRPYWQQEVKYRIDVSLNDRDHSLKGRIELDYTNNSPDTLAFIWFHLWPNAYKNESTAFASQLFRDKEGKKRWSKMKDRGFIDSLDFSVNSRKATVVADSSHIDIVKLMLNEPLLPGSSAAITSPFYVKLPTYTSRSGHSGQSYMVCQWYPKPAVYDRKGWHPMPYLDQGEFYSEFGSFDVNITLPSSYIVGATGELQQADELRQYREIGSRNVQSASRKNVISYTPAAAALKTLSYHGENIHDFAWFADKDFVIRYDTLQLPSGRVVDVFTYHHPGGNPNWVKSTSYVKDGTRAYSGYLGEYAYPVVQAVEGPKNEMSGGMEYPMITLITSPTADEETLDAVITHEVGHNWLYGMLASNERIHAWLDEGLNTYLQLRYEAEKYRAISVFGNALPSEYRQKSFPDFQASVYQALNKIPMEEYIDKPAAEFSKDDYGSIQYLKTSIWLYIMELKLGKDELDKALQAYFTEWRFKHPYPEDLKAVMEKTMNRNLGPYFDLLKKTGSF